MLLSISTRPPSFRSCRSPRLFLSLYFNISFADMNCCRDLSCPRNSQVVPLLSQAPTAFKAATLSQSPKEREALKEEEYTEEKKVLSKPSDIALKSAEYEEKEAPVRGYIDLRYYYNMARDPNSLSTGRNTNSTEPGSIGRASNDATEVTHPAPRVSRPRISRPRTSSPSAYPCLHPHCGYISSSAHNLKRHMTVHFRPKGVERYDCKYEWCGRTGDNGFIRDDTRKEHYRKFHMKEREYPRTGRRGRTLSYPTGESATE